MPHVFEQLLGERRTVYICINFRMLVGDLSFFFKTTLSFNQFGSQRIDAFAVVVVALQGVAIRESGSFLDGHATAAVSTKAALVFDVHDIL